MAKRYITVRVVDSGGKPAYYAKVSLSVSGQMGVAPGSSLPSKQTDREGIAEFEVDLDQSAKIAIYVNGSEKVRSGPIRGEYKVST